ncbi:hypothetical protein C8039_08270 [Halogeometricum sp. wsp3]|nr:hypothetical protein C8039_08270 [Halogeometricum sp. wsp3]
MNSTERENTLSGTIDSRRRARWTRVGAMSCHPHCCDMTIATLDWTESRDGEREWRVRPSRLIEA